MTRTFGEDLQRRLLDPEFVKGFGAAQAKSSLAMTLAQAREDVRLTQHGLAERLGVSQAYIAKLEGGEANPTFARIGSLLAVIGLGLATGTVPLSPYATGTAVLTDASVETSGDSPHGDYWVTVHAAGVPPADAQPVLA
jgi:transcriptional regulator with XRE-family HTH domain